MPKKNGKPTKAELLHEKFQIKLFDDNYVIENAEILNWSKINTKYQISSNVIDKCHKYIKWYKIVKTQQLSQEIIKKYAKKMPSIEIVRNQKLSIETINNIKHLFNYNTWEFLSRTYILPFDFIEQNMDHLKLDILHISHLTKLQQELIESIIIMRKLS